MKKNCVLHLPVQKDIQLCCVQLYLCLLYSLVFFSQIFILNYSEINWHSIDEISRHTIYNSHRLSSTQTRFFSLYIIIIFFISLFCSSFHSSLTGILTISHFLLHITYVVYLYVYMKKEINIWIYVCNNLQLNV